MGERQGGYPAVTTLCIGALAKMGLEELTSPPAARRARWSNGGLTVPASSSTPGGRGRGPRSRPSPAAPG